MLHMPLAENRLVPERKEIEVLANYTVKQMTSNEKGTGPVVHCA